MTGERRKIFLFMKKAGMLIPALWFFCSVLNLESQFLIEE